MNKLLANALYACFLLSGAAALAYEIVWQRMLTLVFGVSTWSVTAVLTAFMAGLALGSWGIRRYADRCANPIRAYAILEFSIALAAFAVSNAIEPLMSVYVQIAHAIEPGFLVSHVIRFLLAFVVFVVPSTLLGATIPLMSRIATAHRDSTGAAFGRIYAFNTFGSVVGAGLCGFALIPTIGMWNASLCALIGNLIAGALALMLASRWRSDHQPRVSQLQRSEASSTVSLNNPRFGSLSQRSLLAISAGLGFLGLGYEVAWSRLLAVYTLNSVYVFTMLITVYLGGLALGSGIAAVILRKAGQVVGSVLTIVQFVIALTGPLVLLTTLYLGEYSTELQMAVGGRVFWVEYTTTLAIVFVPSVLMGMSLPLLVELFPNGAQCPGASVGRAYAANASGTVLGTASTGLLFIPYLGIRASIILLSVCNFILGCVILQNIVARSNWQRGLTSVSAVVFVLAATLVPQGTQFIRPTYDPLEAIVYYKEGRSSVAHVALSQVMGETHRSLFVDSQPVAGTTDYLVTDQKILAHLPLLLHPDPKRAISVGFGTGGTSYSMKLHGIETHCVEIEPAVPAASRHFTAQNHGIVGLRQGLDPDRTDYRIIIDDARSWFHLATTPYDVIVDDLTSLQYRGNGNLYTVECFELIKKNLTENGIGCAWVPVNGIDKNALKIVIQSFKKVFPHTTVWYLGNVQNYFVVLTGTPERLMVDIESWRSRISEPEVYEDLEEIGLTNPLELAASVLLTEEEVERFVGSAPLHTDDKPILDYATHASFYKETMASNLQAMLACQSAPRSDWIKPVEDPWMTTDWPRWRDAAKYVVEGHALARNRDSASATELFREAAAMIPESKNVARLAGIPNEPTPLAP